jgi:hypothetical protein
MLIAGDDDQAAECGVLPIPRWKSDNGISHRHSGRGGLLEIVSDINRA